MATFKIGKNQITVNGNSISVVKGVIAVDGKKIDIPTDERIVNIIVQGDVQSLKNETGYVHVNGNTGSVRMTSGNIEVMDCVNGNVDLTSGDVIVQGVITGNVRTTSGDVKSDVVYGDVNTVSGDIKATKKTIK